MLYRQHDLNQVGANSGIKSFLSRAKVMFGGDGLKEVINQAEFIGQTREFPIVQLGNGRVGAFKLACNSLSLRRKFTHKVFCFLFFIALSVIGMKLNRDN